MATDADIIAKAVDGTLEQIQKYAPEEYAKLVARPEEKEAIIQAARSAATEQLTLAKELAGRPDDIEQRLRKHLPESRMKLLRGGLDLPTFRMDITKKSDGKHWAELTAREGKTFKPPRQLAAASDIDWATIMQYASIVVEAVMLVMSAVGISASPGSGAIESTVEDVAHAIQTSTKLEKAVQKFVAAWSAAGGSKWAKAKAIFSLIKDTYSGGILWTIIKSLCQNMSWVDWLETSAKVTAMIIAALATDGAALIAEIALIVLSAVDFARKIANVVQLSTLKGSL